MSSQPSFFTSLFDFSFSQFVTLRLVKFLYVVSMITLVFAIIVPIVQVFTSADRSGVEALGIIVLAPVAAFLYLVGVRVGLELVVVVFRIGETATEIRDLLSASSSSSSSA